MVPNYIFENCLSIGCIEKNLNSIRLRWHKERTTQHKTYALAHDQAESIRVFHYIAHKDPKLKPQKNQKCLSH